MGNLIGTQRVLYCAHCGNTTPHELLGYSLKYGLMVCGTCHEASLYINCIEARGFDVPENLDFNDAVLIWPKPAELHPAVPKRVQEIYKEAASIMQRSPNGFANQIRRAVEAICKDRGEPRGSLAERLKRLADQGVIPGALADMTEFLRILGNVGSHDDNEDDVDPSYVQPVGELLLILIGEAVAGFHDEMLKLGYQVGVEVVAPIGGYRQEGAVENPPDAR
ncbi:MAG: DUF4145 domain-containing protein [Acidobacteria bacterium]|nr:DUF4145 domain-containing protein [Acidobacteriota bacterium]